MRRLQIGKFKITAPEFAFDGCHKFYLIENYNCKQNMRNAGWEDKNFYPIEKLQEMYENCDCCLKFINRSGLYNFETIVPQFRGYTIFAWVN